MKPSLRQLEYLVAIADTGRFADAARRLNVAQPSLSAQVAEAEAQLGVVVFERGRQGALVTPVGEQIIKRARFILREMEELKAVAEHGGVGLYGRLKLGVLPTIGPYLLPHCTRTLHARYPDLRLIIRDLPTDELGHQLDEGVLDTIISCPDDHPGCETEFLFSETLWIAVDPTDPLAASQSPVRLDELAGRPFLTLGLGHRLTRLVESLAAEAGGVVSLDYQGTSLDAIRNMAALGTGLAVLPELYVKCEAHRDSSLVFRRIASDHAWRNLALVWRNNSPLADHLSELADVMRRAASKLLERQLGVEG